MLNFGLIHEVADKDNLACAFDAIKHAPWLKQSDQATLLMVESNWDRWVQGMHGLLVSGEYQFGTPCLVQEGEDTMAPSSCHVQLGNMLWAVEDVLVLMALAMTLSKNYNGKLNESSVYQAFDVHSLLNQNVRRRKPDAIKCAQYLSGEYEFVLVAKVVGYHSSISHAILDECCREWIVDAHIQDLLCQYLNSVSRVYSGEEKDESMIRQGLPRGSLLAEFLIDLYLVSIDKVAKASNCGYIRHGADICLFTSSHFQLSRMVQRLYGVLEMIGLSIDQNRLCLGKTRPDFKFLGRDIVQSSLPII